MTVHVEVITQISAPPQLVFDLELGVDLHTASLTTSGETARTSTVARTPAPGDQVTFTARHLGRTRAITAVITEHEHPSHFVDEQPRGRFRQMRHEHLFAPDGAGGTLMVDRTSVQAPGAPRGAVVAAVVLRPYLERLLVTRAQHVKKTAATAARPR